MLRCSQESLDESQLQNWHLGLVHCGHTRHTLMGEEVVAKFAGKSRHMQLLQIARPPAAVWLCKARRITREHSTAQTPCAKLVMAITGPRFLDVFVAYGNGGPPHKMGHFTGARLWGRESVGKSDHGNSIAQRLSDCLTASYSRSASLPVLPMTMKRQANRLTSAGRIA